MVQLQQRSLFNTALRFPGRETKEPVVTFVSRWCGTEALAAADVSAAAKSYLWLLIAGQGLITLINGMSIWGPGLRGLLSVSVQLKRSHRRPVENGGAGGVVGGGDRGRGSVSGLIADTSHCGISTERLVLKEQHVT